ncbi:MAG: transposase [Planctomycetota bacterium]|nr:transposase [Planctomycetota bacterium]
MPRPHRIDIANGVYHVTNRGVDRCDIVRDDKDRMNWFKRLDESSQRHGWRVFAFALMDNHFHLFLHMDARHAPSWLDWPAVLAQSARNVAQARMAYRKFVMDGADRTLVSPLCEATDDGILGSDDFVRSVRVTWGTTLETQRVEISAIELTQIVAGTMNVSVDEIRQTGRRGNVPREIAICLCRELCGEPLSELAGLFGGVSRSSITDMAGRCREKCQRSPAFEKLVSQVRDAITRQQGSPGETAPSSSDGE